MSNLTLEELNVIKGYKEELKKKTDRNSINKTYRQVRIWNRWHHFMGDACDYETYLELNEIFKRERIFRLNEVEGGKIYER